MAGDPYGQYNYTLNENGKQVSNGSTAADYGTDVYYGKALDFIQRAAAQPSQPIFIYLAVYAPHAPYTPAPRHASLFPTATTPRTPAFNEADVSDKPAYISSKPPLSQSDISGIDDDYRNHLRCLQAVDEAIAGLVSAARVQRAPRQHAPLLRGSSLQAVMPPRFTSLSRWRTFRTRLRG